MKIHPAGPLFCEGVRSWQMPIKEGIQSWAALQGYMPGMIFPYELIEAVQERL